MKSIIVFLLVALPCLVSSQNLFTKKGEISFTSKAQFETIEATNLQGTSVIDGSNGRIQWAVLIKAFRFDKALMEEHFNENYMESQKYPKATFSGQIENFSSVDLSEAEPQIVTISGKITIHGKEKEITAQATFSQTPDGLIGFAEMDVNLADFDIDIPAVVSDNISETVHITLRATYQPLLK